MAVVEDSSSSSVIKVDGDVERFLSDVNDLIDSIRKIGQSGVALNTELGNDVASVQVLRKNHDELEAELLDLEKRVILSTNTAENVLGQHPDVEVEIINSQSELSKVWEETWQQVTRRKRLLSDSFDYQRFLADYRENASWINTLMDPNEFEFAQENEEIRVRQHSLNQWFIFGQLLIEANHFASSEIKKCLGDLSISYRNLQHALLKGNNNNINDNL